MSLTTTTVQPQAETPVPVPTQPDNHSAPLLAAVMMSVFAAQLSRRQLRRLKRRAMWGLVKARFSALFGRRDSGISNRTLIYILLGVAVVILCFVAPVAAIVLLLLGILLLLLNNR
ncbi:hypothetical protein [Flaviaesturariibacter amylovorans]|uniref:Uncharacterized protein n=1 Tax=Flaviaesturariibacter amylovorans TaxID=1084520 RepID=A0ABP8GT04_9BACT